MIWEYVFDLTNSPCWQTNGNTYWVSVNVSGFDTNLYLFGWKTCPTNWNDDAVFRDVSGPILDWRELRRPPDYFESLDLAFEILTTSTNPPPPPPTNVVDKWLQVPDTTPNGLDVRATEPKQLADDFLCGATGPINRVRIWGSWLNDALPPSPPFFSVGIWTDVPRKFYARLIEVSNKNSVRVGRSIGESTLGFQGQTRINSAQTRHIMFVER